MQTYVLELHQPVPLNALFCTMHYVYKYAFIWIMFLML